MSLPFSIEEIDSDAVWSGRGPEDSRYRYQLRHAFPEIADGGDGGTVLFIMMNPSYADEDQWDNTVRRCAGYAYGWGYGAVSVGNIFAFRTPFPKGGTDKHGNQWPPIWEEEDPVGPDNDAALLEMLSVPEVGEVVCAWGNAGEKLGRGCQVYDLIQASGHTPQALRVNASGQPAHPLYLPKDLTPTRYARRHIAA